MLDCSSMAKPAQQDQSQDPRQLLYDAYLAVPDHQRAEIIDGTLYVAPRPSSVHADAATGVVGELRGPFQRGRGGPGGWRILFEPELQLVDLEPMVPDVAGWRLERMPTMPRVAHFKMAPDWICEVLSRSTESVDRDRKMPIYAAQGVGHVWLIDPIAKMLEVHSLGEDRRWRHVRVFEGSGLVRADPFAELEFDLSSLWDPQ